MPQIAALEIGFGESGPGQDCAGEITARQNRFTEVGAGQVGVSETGPRPLGTVERRLAQIGSVEGHTVQPGAREIRLAQIRACQDGAGDVRAGEDHAVQAFVSQVERLTVAAAPIDAGPRLPGTAARRTPLLHRYGDTGGDGHGNDESDCERAHPVSLTPVCCLLCSLPMNMA